MSTCAKLALPLALAGMSLSLLSTAGWAADGDANVQAAVDHAFRPLLKRYDVPGIAVAVTVDGNPFFFNYGMADKERQMPVTKDTLFEIGSLSKTFTATLASYALTLGKMSLEDHPGKFMSQLRGSTVDKASLLNLGTFTAGGLPLQFPDDVADADEMPAYFQHWKSSFAPGVQRLYSNPSIGLFGHIAGLAMERNFTDLVQSELFPKLGLKASYIKVPEAEMNHYAWGYSKAGKPIRVNPGVFDAEAYGAKSTAADMLRFLEDNIKPETLDMPMRRAIEGTHVGYFKVGEMVQGLGWEQYAYPVPLARLLSGNSDSMVLESHVATRLTPPRVSSQPTLFNKTGSTYGFGAYAAFVPAKRIGIVMLANKNFPIAARVRAAHAVIEQLARPVAPR